MRPGRLPHDRMKTLITETRSELITKIVRTLNLKAHEIGEMVELYYDVQHLRIAHANKERTEPPSELAQWLDFWDHVGETVINGALKRWLEGPDSPGEAKWAYGQIGIGPVLAAGLAAHIDVTRADSVSAVWKFAGLAPGYDRKVKGTKLPYNARLKTLCWKLGESFCKVSNKEGATYGHLYAEFKAQEIKRNESGLYVEAAQRELSAKKFKTDDSVTKKRLLAGMLSDGHLHSRAKRRAVKLFLSHYYVEGRKARGLSVREPYAIGILNHSGLIEAKLFEKPRGEERAKVLEQSKSEERAVEEEQTKSKERAKQSEKPKARKRAN
jgi:hypothetical protein